MHCLALTYENPQKYVIFKRYFNFHFQLKVISKKRLKHVLKIKTVALFLGLVHHLEILEFLGFFIPGMEFFEKCFFFVENNLEKSLNFKFAVCLV